MVGAYWWGLVGAYWWGWVGLVGVGGRWWRAVDINPRSPHIEHRAPPEPSLQSDFVARSRFSIFPPMQFGPLGVCQVGVVSKCIDMALRLAGWYGI